MTPELSKHAELITPGIPDAMLAPCPSGRETGVFLLVAYFYLTSTSQLNSFFTEDTGWTLNLMGSFQGWSSRRRYDAHELN